MSVKHNKALIRRYYVDLWNAWNLASAEEIVAGDVAFRGSLGMEVQGLEGFKDYVNFVRRVFPDFHNCVDDLIAEGDRVVARLTYSGTHASELFGISPTGKRVTYSGVAIFRIAAGKIIDGWVLGDTRELQRQLGGGAPHPAARLEPARELADRAIIEALDALLKGGSIRATIDPIVRQVEQRLGQDRTAVMAWEPIALTAYRGKLPAVIRSSWVFVLRGGAKTGAERHPNSHQRMMSYRGKGDLQMWAEDRWRSNLLVSEGNADLGARWISVPPNVWHQAVVPDQDWVVVSFHTVAAEELIEERPDAVDQSRTHQRRYVAASD